MDIGWGIRLGLMFFIPTKWLKIIEQKKKLEISKVLWMVILIYLYGLIY